MSFAFNSHPNLTHHFCLHKVKHFTFHRVIEIPEITPKHKRYSNVNYESKSHHIKLVD